MTRSLTHSQRLDWLRLSLSENVGPATFRALIARYGDAGAALMALPELSRKGGLPRPIRLYGHDEAEADLERAAALGVQAVVAGEAHYPELLRHIDAAPPVLWLRGELKLANQTAVAIVGSRNASAVGLKFTRMLAGEIGRAGHAIISGLARGIDTAAHEAALESGTCGVLASGIDVVYPPENARLQAAIGERGLLVSEMKPRTVPRAEHFPRRNRIISGMARATIVVEAAMRSGSLITARLAAEQGREVFAVPGSPLDPRAEGTNRLIREGATLISSAKQVLEALMQQQFQPEPMFLEPDSNFAAEPGADVADRKRLITLLSPSPIGVDDLIRESGIRPATILSVLLELELAGRITRSPRGLVSLA